MTTYVLVPGACHGRWYYDELAARLRDHGHRVLAITLTGVAERAHLAHAGVNLETHIADVLAELDAQQVTDAVLVGHSYGGMVITAVADRVAAQIDSLVYLDAFVPADGDSCWNLVTDDLRDWYADVDATGYGVPPLPFFDERATAHPLASLMQPIRLTGDLSRFRRRVYVYATQWDGEPPFAALFERLNQDPSWTTHALDSTHNLLAGHTDEVLQILLDVAGHQGMNAP
ncbi:alpha/beta fold hydrolase [Mycolicibacterium wolinskyi]|uniref:Esterase n=1 Tax=Mycolicibacterium wolinskyi TaxID=59750 RepID=A0A1X2EVN8_9MYCO|nr:MULTISPECIES: alpha/beta hydrolase [Mycolicibacterium]MCV7289668.1 alpha/beta fold hydrolase [Mycolicibacterium wolinskyi]MCV7296639.1 alpha/beta fold hydrolase [Mycolicibacterium goodii]ORX10206.1 esterase [Mycolicibacterium wolinskyi]